MRILISILLVSLFATRAFAAEPVSIIVAGDPTVAPQITEHLETWLREHGHAPVRTALPTATLDAVAACFDRDDDECARTALAKRVTTATFVFAKIELRPGAENTRNIMLTAYWSHQGREAIADRRFCERCTPQLLRQSGDELMTAITKSSDHATGHLVLTSTPPAAMVVVDGVAIGATPIAYDLAPGNHQVTITATGSEVETRQITVREGETTRVGVSLVPAREDSGRPLRIVPLAVMAGGVALAVTGAVLIAGDEDESPTGPMKIQDTAPLGVALVAAGGVAVVAGAYLWVRAGRTPSSAPVASVSSSTAYFGWSGQF